MNAHCSQDVVIKSGSAGGDKKVFQWSQEGILEKLRRVCKSRTACRQSGIILVMGMPIKK